MTSRIFDIWRLFCSLFKGFDYLLVWSICLLTAAGLLIMYSTGDSNGSKLIDHLRNILIATFILIIVAQVPPHRLIDFAVPVYVVGVGLLMAVAWFGITKKGAQRWLNVGIVLQPSEIFKIAVPLMLAWWFEKRQGEARSIDFLFAFLLLIFPVFLILKQPDLGTAILIMSGGVGVIFFAGLSWRWFFPLIIVALVTIILTIIFEPSLCQDGVRWVVLREYQQQRICTLLDPTRDPLGKGFHIIQGMIAIGSGGFWGKGLMQGTQNQLEFIPERTTDFIFAAFSEEFGFFGNLILVGGFILLVLRGLCIALEAPSLFSRLLAGGITVIFFTYTFVNIAMVTGVLPVVGVPLPFVSYGGTAMVTLGLGMGILMSIAKSKQLNRS